MPAITKNASVKKKVFFKSLLIIWYFPDCYTEVSNAMATAMIKSFLWNLTFEQEYLFRKSDW